MSRSAERITLKRRLTWGGAAAVAVFIFLSLGVQSLSAYRALIVDRQTYQDSIALLIFDTIKQPLMQGSFFEARARLQQSLERGEIDCAALTMDSLEFNSCRDYDLGSLRWTERSLAQTAELAGYKGSLRLGFSQASAHAAFARQLAIALLITLFCAYLVRRLIGYGFRFLETEVDQLTRTLSQDGAQDFSFRTLEFGLLYDRLRELFSAKAKLVESEAFAVLAKSVVHDIRSPLSTLKIISRKGLQAEGALPLLAAATERLEGIANHMLNYSRPGARHSLADLKPQLTKLVEEYRAREGVTILTSMEIAAENWQAAASSVEVGAVIDNLLKNAVEAGAKQITLSGRLRDQRLLLEVSDDGSGIDARLAEELGKTPVRSTKASGSGMGLFLTTKKLEAWGGSLRFAKGPSRGTTASLNLPVFIS